MNFNKLIYAGLALVLTTALACNSGDFSKAPATKLDTNIDSVSFAYGYQNAKMLAGSGAEEFNYEQFLAGFMNGMSGNEVLEEMEQMQLLNNYFMALQQLQMDKNSSLGAEFLADNLEKEGVSVTESGLQYKVLEEGTGKSPVAEDMVEVNYEGRLIDGRVFDSSYERGETAQFPLDRVIPGWTEGVQLMKEGATYEFYIPSELAYGPNAPQGSIIEPNATLIFKVELIKVGE